MIINVSKELNQYWHFIIFLYLVSILHFDLYSMFSILYVLYILHPKPSPNLLDLEQTTCAPQILLLSENLQSTKYFLFLILLNNTSLVEYFSFVSYYIMQYKNTKFHVMCAIKWKNKRLPSKFQGQIYDYSLDICKEIKQ